MSPEDVRQQREALAYIKDVKDMILTDARALFAARGLTHRSATLDVITSTYGGAYQATLILYPNPGDSKAWTALYEGCRCKDMCTAMKMLWDGIQTGLGDMKAMQYAALMSPTTTRSSQVQMSPPPMEMPSRTVSAENAHADGAE